MTDRFGPEISDLIVAYDPETLARKDVQKQSVLDELRRTRVPGRAARAAQALGENAGVLDRAAVDGVLVRSHLELQRLHEEFRVAAHVRDLLVPMIEAVRSEVRGEPIRIVDIGCGLGFVLRWLAARGNLGSDVKLIGADYNVALVEAANRLATAEQLACTFAAANAFTLSNPAHIVISTGVLHHFRGPDLTAFFEQHERSGAHAFIHTDIRPSFVAPLGSWIFHQARMRERLAQFDGY